MIELAANISQPSHSARNFRSLNIRLNSLSQGLQVAGVPACQRDVDRIHAFRLLAHAEIQSYMEDIVSRVLAVSSEALTLHNRVTHGAHHLMVFHEILKLSSKQSASGATYPYFDRLSIMGISLQEYEKAANAHRNRIKRNNGVKAADIRTLFGPLGYRDNWFRPGFLDQMNAFGEARGNVAHQSGAIGASLWPTASSELSVVRSLYPGLADLDRYGSRVLMPV